MDLLDLPQDMFWSAAAKSEPLSPDYQCSPLTSGSSCSSPFLGADATDDAAAQQLWPEEDIFLSCFDEEDATTTTTSITLPQYHRDEVEEEQEEDLKKITNTFIAVDEEEMNTLKHELKGAEELLQELIEINEEGQWLTQENIDLSMLTSGAAASATCPADNVHAKTVDTYDSAATELIFNEIKTFCNDFEAAGYQHLTPPQSPPTSPMVFTAAAAAVNTTINQQPPPPPQGFSNICFDSTSSPSMTFAAFDQLQQRSCVDLQLQSNDCLDKTFVPATTDPDIVALELIDELLRNKTKDVHENYVLVNTQLTQQQQQQQQPQSLIHAATRDDNSMDYCDDNATQYSTPSYGNSLASSPSRSSSCCNDSQDDEEWMSSGSTAAAGNNKKAQKRTASAATSSASPAKRRPYERGGGEQEKKSRKKEQNKNAATRYRQKKKQEVETILEEETRLLKTNKKLTAQFNEARREMKYLRNLLRDVYSQNGIVV